MRLGLIDFLLAIVYADGVVTPAEVKAMERIYSLFGMDTAALYTKLHSLGAVPEGGSGVVVQKTGAVQIDRAKVERLRAVSAEVTRTLTVIFESGEDTGGEQAAPQDLHEASSDAPPQTLLGLDTAHAELLAVLMGRPEWSRAEIEELCNDKGLMTDGAIERINEAAFARFDQPA